MIWDFILIKNNKSKDDLFIAFALILNVIKQDIYDCANIIQLERVLREKALLIDDYDFFCALFGYGKEKDWKPAFTLHDGEALRQNFISLDRVKQEMEYERKQEFDQDPNMPGPGMEEAKQFNINNVPGVGGDIHPANGPIGAPGANTNSVNNYKPNLTSSAMQSKYCY